MSKVFNQVMSDLGEVSGYSYDFLCNKYNEIWEEDGDVDMEYFVGVSMERDWTVSDIHDLQPKERPIYKKYGENEWVKRAKTPRLATLQFMDMITRPAACC